jgi:hypothetical protein
MDFEAAGGVSVAAAYFEISGVLVSGPVQPAGAKPWTEAMTAFARRMRRRGKTFAWIARALGFSRGDCVAALAREGVLCRATAPVARVETGDEPVAIGGTREVLDAGVCRWIAGDPCAADWRMCGHPSVHGSSWCEHHFARVSKQRAGDGV